MLRPLVVAANHPPLTTDPRQLSSVGNFNASQAVFLRASGSQAITKIRIQVGTQSGNVDVGVYANNGLAGTLARPGLLRASAGGVACPAPGVADVPLTTPLIIADGDWLALVPDNAVATFMRSGAGGVASALGDGLSAFMNAAYPLPAVCVPTSGFTWSWILVGVA